MPDMSRGFPHNYIRQIDVYRSVGLLLKAIENRCHCEESPEGADVAISFMPGAKRRKIARYTTLYRQVFIEIASLLRFLAMTYSFRRVRPPGRAAENQNDSRIFRRKIIMIACGDVILPCKITGTTRMPCPTISSIDCTIN